MNFFLKTIYTGNCSRQVLNVILFENVIYYTDKDYMASGLFKQNSGSKLTLNYTACCNRSLCIVDLLCYTKH